MNYQLDGTGVTIDQMRETGVVALADAPILTPRRRAQVPDPSGRIEIDSETLTSAGLASLPPYQPKEPPADDRFVLLFAKTATLAQGQSLNNPILHTVTPEQVLWIHPDRAAPLGIRDGEPWRSPAASLRRKPVGARVTPWIDIPRRCSCCTATAPPCRWPPAPR